MATHHEGVKFSKILVPVDFSEVSLAALKSADELARDTGAELTLAHVHPYTTVSVLDYTYAEPPEVVAQVCAAIEDKLKALVHTLKTPAERCHVVVQTGDPAAELMTMSADHDLVVMSTHGRTGVRRFLLGSVAERLVRGARCSVLVVRHKDAD